MRYTEIDYEMDGEFKTLRMEDPDDLDLWELIYQYDREHGTDYFGILSAGIKGNIRAVRIVEED